MLLTEFKTFNEMKERRSVNKPLTDDMRIKNIKELDNMRDILSKTKRKPTQEEKI